MCGISSSWPAPIEMTIGDPEARADAGFLRSEGAAASSGRADRRTRLSTSRRTGRRSFAARSTTSTQNPFKPSSTRSRPRCSPASERRARRVVIVEFSDFECPYCKEEAKTLRDNLLKTYPKEVRVYFFDFPLESCIPGRSRRPSPGAASSARALGASGIITTGSSPIRRDITADNLKAKVLEFAKTKKDLDADAADRLHGHEGHRGRREPDAGAWGMRWRSTQRPRCS